MTSQRFDECYDFMTMQPETRSELINSIKGKLLRLEIVKQCMPVLSLTLESQLRNAQRTEQSARRISLCRLGVDYRRPTNNHEWK